MRYADGPTVEVSLVIGAPPAEVWAAVTDIELPARFSTEFLGARWLDGGTCSVGARFAGRNHHEAIGEWETVCTVTEAEPGKVFAYTVDSGDPDAPSATWRYTLVPEGESTRLDFWMRMGPGRGGLNAAIDAMPDKEERIVARRCGEHQTNMLRTLEGIRQVAEGG